jgi:kynurenine formamidase
LLLIENGIYLFEGIYLEELARERVYEFLFIALPLKIQGTTGSMLDPVAIV